MNLVRAITDFQLGFYWDHSLWPRLQGLTDEEYLWEPAPGAWSVRPGPDGALILDGRGEQEPDPPPVTTIAWRIVHIAYGVFATRASTFFGDGSVPADADMFDDRHWPDRLPGTAAEALETLDRSYRWWREGLLSMTEDEFLQPLGPRGSFFRDDSMFALALHLNRETMHHGGELGLLRDLYRATGATSRTDHLAVARA
jgi:hypothetical protein